MIIRTIVNKDFAALGNVIDCLEEAPLREGAWFRVSGFGFRVSGLGFRVSGSLGFGVWGLGFRV